MPPLPIFDVSKIDQTKLLATREQIAQVNPQRFEFEQLDGIFFMDESIGVLAGFRDLKSDEFWVRGHIPGRPVFPGVLMIECAAQLTSYYVMTHLDKPGFVGFGGVDAVKFRGQVLPGDRLIMLGKLIEFRGRRRCIAQTQGFVKDQMVFEGTITGMVI
jgi:3-hydroxyacyl-[acyl-carrier-protein] dehydratase